MCLAYGVWRVTGQSVDVALQTGQVRRGGLDVVKPHGQWSVVFQYLIHVLRVGCSACDCNWLVKCSDLTLD